MNPDVLYAVSAKAERPVRVTLKSQVWEFPGGRAVKDLASLLWHKFDPLPRKLCIPQARSKKKKKKMSNLMEAKFN